MNFKVSIKIKYMHIITTKNIIDFSKHFDLKHYQCMDNEYIFSANSEASNVMHRPGPG